MEEPLSIKATLLSKTEREFEIPKSQLSFALNKTYEKEIYENFGVVFLTWNIVILCRNSLPQKYSLLPHMLICSQCESTHCFEKIRKRL